MVKIQLVRRLWIRFPGMFLDLPEDYPMIRLAQVAQSAGWKLRFNRRTWRLEVVE
jgi:hypothetical protein